MIGITVLEGGGSESRSSPRSSSRTCPRRSRRRRGCASRAWDSSACSRAGPWWLVCAVAAVAAGLGYGLLEDASGDAIGLIQAFAGGAVLTMLADTMFPERLHRGMAKGEPALARQRPIGLATVLGFALAYLLSTLE